MELDDILNGPAPEETLVAEAEALAPESTDEDIPGQPRDDHGRFAPKGDTEPTPAPGAPLVEAAPPAAEREHRIPPEALAEERRKRQELDAWRVQTEPELQQLRQWYAQAQQQQAQQEQFIPSVYEDENGFAHGLTQQAVQLARQQLMPEVQQHIGHIRIEVARDMMRMQNPDFDATEQAFAEMARGNQALIDEANRQPNPVLWAYNYAKKAQEVRQIGSLDLEAIRAAAVKDYLAQNPQPQAAAPQIPTSLADTQSSRALSSPGVALGAPPSLNDILGRK